MRKAAALLAPTGLLALALLGIAPILPACDTGPDVDPVEGVWEGGLPPPADYVRLQVFHDTGDGDVYGFAFYGGSATGGEYVHRGHLDGDALTTVIHEALTPGGAPGAAVDTLRCRLATRPPNGVGDVLDCDGGALVRRSLDPR